jgi:atlastin
LFVACYRTVQLLIKGGEMSDSDKSDLVMVDHPEEDSETELGEDEKDVTSAAVATGTTRSGVDFNRNDSVVGKALNKRGKALPIVSIVPKNKDSSLSHENAALFAFCFEPENLQSILGRIPADYKVAVVSVVGAFRTGKSFLLSWFLRYLHHQESNKANGGRTNVSDKDQTNTPWYKSFASLGHDGFDWRAGAERNTTGIWMWNEPYLTKTEKGEPLAVLLVDTQGMFDHETTMALTASIFGFSTLLSSYQIYNVDKRIQEDNLQQLALFAEYARTAVARDYDDVDAQAAKGTMTKSNAEKIKPFQRMEFLVRDWQHFDDEDIEGDYEAMEKSMGAYLERVISEREAKDLKDTREQIVSCFEEITCFGLSHPGFAVTKKKYAGDVEGIEEDFLQLLDRYVSRVFSPKSLQPKKIHGRELTAPELGAYIQAYAELFTSGDTFPEATTMLEATASANNANALNLAHARYKDIMDRVAGPKCSNYIASEVLEDKHKLALKESLQVFEEVANFGSKSSIETVRSKVLSCLNQDMEMYSSLNESRNPIAGLTTCVTVTHVLLACSVLHAQS